MPQYRRERALTLGQLADIYAVTVLGEGSDSDLTAANVVGKYRIAGIEPVYNLSPQERAAGCMGWVWKHTTKTKRRTIETQRVPRSAILGLPIWSVTVKLNPPPNAPPDYYATKNTILTWEWMARKGAHSKQDNPNNLNAPPAGFYRVSVTKTYETILADHPCPNPPHGKLGPSIYCKSCLEKILKRIAERPEQRRAVT